MIFGRLSITWLPAPKDAARARLRYEITEIAFELGAWKPTRREYLAHVKNTNA